MSQKLIEILSKYSIEDIIKIEENDRQYIAISKINKAIKNNEYYFISVLANAIVWYQLSWTWEEYWEEFSNAVIKDLSSISNNYNNFDFWIINDFFMDFLPNSKANKRLLNMKLPRIKKLEPFFIKNIWNFENYYKNLSKLQSDLAKIMNQKIDDKTILFAVKMFYYAAKIRFWYQIIIPFEIGIPLDSRLAKLENVYNADNLPRQEFWKIISEEIEIPRLHLDSILWTRCNEFMCY